MITVHLETFDNTIEIYSTIVKFQQDFLIHDSFTLYSHKDPICPYNYVYTISIWNVKINQLAKRTEKHRLGLLLGMMALDCT